MAFSRSRPLSAERVFRRLPQPLKTLAASAHGARLARRRYGGVGRVSETERLVEEALEREHWDRTRWQPFLDELRSKILRHAASRVPHYRRHWRGEPSLDLEDWPVLDKETVRREPMSFVAAGSPKLYPEATSGTTGTPLRLFRSSAVERAWYALFEARSRRWYGVDRFSPWAILGGRLVAPTRRLDPPFWVWNAGLRQLYLSSHHVRPAAAGHYVDVMARRGIRHVYGYPSAVHELARAILETDSEAGRRLGLTVVVTNAEPLLEVQRRDIQSAFGCPVRETWGMAELVAAAGECEHGSMHLWPEVGHVEVVEGDRGSEILATTLIARDQPLIRYRLGDRLPDAPEPPGRATCPCGRTLPVLGPLEGRVDDLLLLPDGRRIGRLDPVFKGDLPLREAQIVQETPDRVRLRYVPADGFGGDDAQELYHRLAERLGPIDNLQILLDEVERVPRESNGKFRAVVRAFDPETPRDE
ncbi:MAG: hypothetical protein MPN21_22820 [Thermoanaerobaculia bacterium]|nr:hypothetical protein [Thermoanaerobaculia bacterium]